MKTAAFGRSVMPALVSNDGVTRLAMGGFDSFNEPMGVDVFEFPAGRPEDARLVRYWAGTFRGDPSLSPDGRLVGFFDAEGRGVVYDIATGANIWTGPVLVGNHAIKLRNDAVVYQTAVNPRNPGVDPNDGIFEQSFDGLHIRFLKPYSASGLAYLTDDGVVTWEENRVAHDPMMIPAFAGGLVIGVSHWTGGLLARQLDGPLREFLRGEEWNDPAACVEGPGRYAFAAWAPKQTLRVWCLTAEEIATWPIYTGKPDVPPTLPLPPTPPTPPPTPEPKEPIMDEQTIQQLVSIILAASFSVDLQHPGLRESNLETWQAKVARIAYLTDARIGRKSTMRGSRISPNALGLRASLDSDVCVVAVDYVRDNPALLGRPKGADGKGPNERRKTLAIYRDLQQAWYVPEPVAEAPDDTPAPPTPPDVPETPAPPTPPAPDRLTVIEQKVDALTVTTDRIANAVQGLLMRPPAAESDAALLQSLYRDFADVRDTVIEIQAQLQRGFSTKLSTSMRIAPIPKPAA